MSNIIQQLGMAIIIDFVICSALTGVLDDVISPYLGTIYGAPLFAISLILSIPTTIIGVIQKSASDY